MKKFLIFLLVISIFVNCTVFSGCQTQHELNEESADRVQEPTLESNPTTENEGQTPAINPLEKIEEQLDSDMSFAVSYEYMHLAINGYSLETKQSYSRDGSFYFNVNTRQWDHRYSFEKKQNVEWYYRYEGEDFICYMKSDDGAVSRSVVSEDVKKAMASDKANIVGFDALFPSYLEDFTEVTAGEEYSFRMPLNEIVQDDAFLSGFLKGVYTLHESEHDPSLDLQIYCTCTVEKDTFRPLKITYDFSELKPYVLSDGALSGEGALDMDLLYMHYEFNYDLPESIEIPEDILNMM